MTDYNNKNEQGASSAEPKIRFMEDFMNEDTDAIDLDNLTVPRSSRRTAQSSQSQSAKSARANTATARTAGASRSSRTASSARTASRTRTEDSGASSREASAPRSRSASATRSNATSSRPQGSRGRANTIRRRKKKFKKMFLTYIAVLVVLLIVGCIFFSIYLSSFEKGQPTHVAEDIVKSYQSQEGIVNFITSNADKTTLLGNANEIAQAYATNIAGKQISYRENNDFRPDSPSYDITADGSVVAKVALSSAGTGAFGSPNWQVESINIADYLPDTMTLTVDVPSGSVVTVNGSTLDASYIVSTGLPEILQDSVKFLANPPQYDTYHLSGLMSDPTISVTDASGNPLTLTATQDGYVASDTDQEFIDSVEYRVYDAIDNYATYFINMSYSLKNYIVYDSDLFSYIFGSDTMDPIATSLYMWEDIAGYEFTERSASNYVKYADDCFTVDVKYALDMEFTDPNYSDDNQKLDATWVFVIEPLDGSWCISEIIGH